MSRTAADTPLKTGGALWGPDRVRLGLSMRELERRSGVGKDVLSRCENGRMIPTAAEYARIMAALRQVEEERQHITRIIGSEP